MSQTAEEQILAAAKQSVIDKSNRLQALDSESIQALVTELQQAASPELLRVLEQLQVDDLIYVFKGLSVGQLNALHEASAARLEALYPRAQARIPQIQTLKLVDFDDEPEADAGGFSLIDFDAEPEIQAESEATKLELREPLWLVNQLTAALYYVQMVQA